MKTTIIGRSGPEIGVLGLGCWRQTEQSPLQARENVELALDLGINLIDTADIYGYGSAAGFGGAEAMLGDMIRETPSLRDRMVLTTKGGIWLPGPYDSSHDYLVGACDRSRERLGVDQIDLYQIHRPDLLTGWEALAETLTHLVESGRVAQIGVSNFTASQFSALQSFLDIPLVSHQPEVSLLQPSVIEGGLMDQWQQHRMIAFCWSPLGGGALATGKCPDGFDADRFAGVMTKVDELAAKYGATRSQIAYAFVLALPGRVVPLVGSGKPERITEAIGALDITLEKPDWYDLYVAARGAPMP